MPTIKELTKSVLKKLRIFHPTRRIACEVYTICQNLRSEESISKIYITEYHRSHGYGLSSRQDNDNKRPSDYVIKREHTKSIMEVLPFLRKVLIGGCSGGMAIKTFREAGVDAWGFDISPNLEQILLPEIYPYVRQGSMTNIPFGPEDKFEALITTDVLEHIQLKNINRMMEEMAKLNAKWMIHLINHTLIRKDHMTLKPIGWWEKRFSRVGYRRRMDMRCAVSEVPCVYGADGDPEHEFTFWEKITQ